MARRLEQKPHAHSVPIRVIRAPAEGLPVASEAFDYVVSTLVLCTVADPMRALGEVRRVLKPTGRLLFLEHVRSDDPKLAQWQDRLRAPWSWFGCCCQCNRPTVDLMRYAGFSVTQLRRAAEGVVDREASRHGHRGARLIARPLYRMGSPRRAVTPRAGAGCEAPSCAT